MTTFSQNNFLIRHEYRDFFSDIQRNTERIGDVGKSSDDFKNRAYSQWKLHDFNDLAKNQDSFIPPDEMYGTRGREKFRNYNRMEYDTPERHDGKNHDEVMAEVNKKTEMTVKNILNAFKKQGYTLCSTASAVKQTPIEQKDYKDLDLMKNIIERY